ncbi:MAG TPA: hypothetical protein PLS74_03945, partial [Bacteroidales bacterium]|nr:hypothetical protein [Bacteroidales bacterium]
MTKKIYCYLLLSFLLILDCMSQNAGLITKAPDFFLDCHECDFTFVRQELPFVSFVRDPQLADVHILVTDTDTGGGGNKFFFNFIGMKELKGINYEYSVTTKQSDTDDDVRRTLLKILKIGILPYYSRTSFIENLNVDIEEKERRTANEIVTDKWKNWVFRIDAGGEFQKEKSQNEFSVTTGFRVQKITDKWKTRLDGIYETNRENYYDEGELITNRQDTKEFNANYIKSLTEKWSAGIFGNYLSRNYLNIRNSFGFSTGVEYNFFPWSECNRRVFAIRYLPGLNFSNYYEETIYDKKQETYFSEALSLKLELIQQWGEADISLTGMHHFGDFSKNRLIFESDVSVRVTKNLSVFCEFQ